MEKLWENIKKTFKESVSTAAEKTEEYTKLGKAKLDILAVKRKISKNFTELGGLIYDAAKEKKTKDVLESPEVKVLINTLTELDNELSKKESVFEELSKKEAPEEEGKKKE